MRVLIVNRAMGTLFGGGEAFDQGAARFLSEAGHEVTVLCGMPLIGPPRHRLPGLNVICLRVPNIRQVAYRTETINKLSAALYYLDLTIFERRAYRWLAGNQRYEHYDVIQVCGLFGLAERIIERWNRPTIGWLPGIPSRRARKQLNRIVEKPGFGLFSHGDTVRFLRGKMGLSHVASIGPGLDLAAIAHGRRTAQTVRATIGIPKDAPLGVTVARLVPVKNLEFLLDGLRRAIRRAPTLHHVVVGGGPLLTNLQRKARSLGLGEIVHFVGQRSTDEVYRILGASDFFVLTSSYESFSIATLEAMAHGLPVIGTDAGYLPDIVRDGATGIIVPGGDVGALENAIVDMAADAAQRSALSANGRKYAAQFAWPTVAEQLASLYTNTRRQIG